MNLFDNSIPNEFIDVTNEEEKKRKN